MKLSATIIYKIIALIAAFSFTFVLCSCNKKVNNNSDSTNSNSGTNAPAINNKSVTLPYSAKDVLNPYIAETKQNQELSRLLYDSLFILDENFNAVNHLADSYEFESNKCIVKLKSATFTDGTDVTSDDIVFSFYQARQGNVYSSQLSPITSCVAIDGNTVAFSQNRHDPNLVNLLDFPIIKSGTAELKDENSRTIPPIGCGRYTFSKEKERLIANDSYYRTSIKLKQINLIDCPDNDSLEHYIATGNISTIYSDLSDGIIPKKSGTPQKSYQTNLIFIGVNCNKSLLNNTKTRLALSSAIDREQLCEKALYGYATEATDIFPADWSKLKGYESLNKIQNSKQTVAYLEEIGYNRKDANEYFTNKEGERLSLSLLCNSDNSTHLATANLVSSQLDKCGIDVTVKQLEWSQYIQELQNNSFDLYIGEVKLSKSLYVYNILNPNVIYGYPYESDCLTKFEEYYYGNSDIMVAISSFATELPFIPICYKNGVTVSSDWLRDYIKFSLSDVYLGIENYG